MTCEGSLFRVTAADILRQRPEGGHAALYALRRIRVILARSPRRDPSLGVPADPDALLRMLDAPGLTWRRREALLADFLAYVEQTDLGPPIEREAWLSRIARFEARYHQNEGDLFLVFPVHEEDPRDRFAWTVRRAAGEGPAFGMIERWGYRHASCPPPKDEG